MHQNVIRFYYFLFALNFNLGARKIFYDYHFLWYMLFVVCVTKSSFFSVFFPRWNLILLSERFWREGEHINLLASDRVVHFKVCFEMGMKTKLKVMCVFPGKSVKSHWTWKCFLQQGRLSEVTRGYMLNWKSAISLGPLFSLITISHEILPSRS